MSGLQWRTLTSDGRMNTLPGVEVSAKMSTAHEHMSLCLFSATDLSLVSAPISACSPTPLASFPSLPRLTFLDSKDTSTHLQNTFCQPGFLEQQTSLHFQLKLCYFCLRLQETLLTSELRKDGCQKDEGEREVWEVSVRLSSRYSRSLFIAANVSVSFHP